MDMKLLALVSCTALFSMMTLKGGKQNVVSKQHDQIVEATSSSSDKSRLSSTTTSDHLNTKFDGSDGSIKDLLTFVWKTLLGEE